MPRKHIPVPVPPGLKWCHKCQRARSPAAFRADRRRPDGLQSTCHECNESRRKERLAIERLCREAARRMMALQYAPTPIPEDYHDTLRVR